MVIRRENTVDLKQLEEQVGREGVEEGVEERDISSWSCARTGVYLIIAATLIGGAALLEKKYGLLDKLIKFGQQGQTLEIPAHVKGQIIYR